MLDRSPKSILKLKMLKNVTNFSTRYNFNLSKTLCIAKFMIKPTISKSDVRKPDFIFQFKLYAYVSFI